jgi:hypothetical protein
VRRGVEPALGQELREDDPVPCDGECTAQGLGQGEALAQTLLCGGVVTLEGVEPREPPRIPVPIPGTFAAA